MTHLTKQAVSRTLLIFLLLLFPSVIALSQEYNYYFGNIHSHSIYSDGAKDGDLSKVRTPAEAFAWAKQSQHFDFLGISEHNHSKAGMSRPNYHKGLTEANSANDDGVFVCLYGMEFGTVAKGHVLIYGIDKLINWENGNSDIACTKGDYKQIWDILSTSPNAFATLAHPKNENFENLLNDTYNAAADKVICGVAIRNGPHSSQSTSYDNPPKGSYYTYYKMLLAAGYKVGPTIDHDNHNTTYGRTSQGRTVILAKSLTRRNIIEAYRAMRFYASDDWNAEVEYAINNKTMGSSLQASKIVLDVRISDPDAEDIRSVEVMYGSRGSGEMPSTLISEEVGNFKYDIEILPDEDIYMYLDITQADGDKIYTAPIWIKGSN